jgi:hypothetical protein
MAVVETAAHGAVLKIGNVASPTAFATIEGIHNGPEGGGWAARVIEAIHHSSTVVKKKASFLDLPDLTFSIYFDSADTVHGTLQTAAQAKTVKKFEYTMTDTGGQIMTFDGVVTNFTFSNNPEEWNVANVTVSFFGAPVVS